MSCFKNCYHSKHFRLSFLRKISLSHFYFSVIFRRSWDQTKQALAVTLLFQCNFLLVVGADNLIWQFYFYFYRILSKWCWLNTKVFIGFSIRSACTQTFHGIRRVNFTGTSKLLYANKAWRRSINFFWYQEGFLNTNTQNFIWYNTNYVRKSNVYSYNMVVSEVLTLKSLIWW